MFKVLEVDQKFFLSFEEFTLIKSYEHIMI